MWLLRVLLTVPYAALLISALAEWVRHPHTRYLSRWACLPIILVFSGLGPVAYLCLGRATEMKAE